MILAIEVLFDNYVLMLQLQPSPLCSVSPMSMIMWTEWRRHQNQSNDTTSVMAYLAHFVFHKHHHNNQQHGNIIQHPTIIVYYCSPTTLTYLQRTSSTHHLAACLTVWCIVDSFRTWLSSTSIGNKLDYKLHLGKHLNSHIITDAATNYPRNCSTILWYCTGKTWKRFKRRQIQTNLVRRF